MKIIKLVTHAYVGGSLRAPDDGPLTVDDAEAGRLVEAGLAEDVSDDFAEKTAKKAAE